MKKRLRKKLWKQFLNCRFDPVIENISYIDPSVRKMFEELTLQEVLKTSDGFLFQIPATKMEFIDEEGNRFVIDKEGQPQYLPSCSLTIGETREQDRASS